MSNKRFFSVNGTAIRNLVINTILLTSLLVYTNGCTAVILEAGNGAYNHLRGDLLGIVPDKLPDVYNASTMAINNLSGYDLEENEINTLNGHIVAYDKEDRKIIIDLSRTEEDQTSIQIRIGLVGDKLESVMLYDQIKKCLLNPKPNEYIF